MHLNQLLFPVLQIESELCSSHCLTLSPSHISLIMKHLPNIITLSNLFCGCVALICLFSQQYYIALLWILLGGIADYCDGLVARALGVHSDLGKELDSLADMVTFGVVPGTILYILLANEADIHQTIDHPVVAALPGFLVTLFSCLRLAMFNLDDSQHSDFRGMPTPGSTLLIAGLLLLALSEYSALRQFVTHPAFLYPYIVLHSWLLVSPIRMFSLKMKSFQWHGNEIRYIFLLIAIILVLLLQLESLAFVMVAYVVLSLGRNSMK